MQFGRVQPLGGGKFRLSHLLRGRGGTEWACAQHASGEIFCLIEPKALQPAALPTWSLGATVTAQAAGATNAIITLSAEVLRPPSPVNLAAERLFNGDLEISWIRRSRQGFAWVDYVDAPLGEAREQYRVSLNGSIGTIELLSEQPAVTMAATTVATVGVGEANIQVRQIGDLAASHPAELTVTLS
jgi:hypothetical protein